MIFLNLYNFFQLLLCIGFLCINPCHINSIHVRCLYGNPRRFFSAPSGLWTHLGRRPHPWSVRFSSDPVQAHHHWAQEYLCVRVSVTTTTTSSLRRLLSPPHSLVVVGRRSSTRPLHHALHRHGRAPRRREPLAPPASANPGSGCFC